MRWLLPVLVLAAPVWAQSLVLSPAQGETVSTARPVITVQIPKSHPIPYDVARLWVNGKEVMGLLRTPMFVSYQPPGELAQGPVAVRFTAGNTTLNWDFVIKPRPLITSVGHDALENLGEYDEVHITLKGEPGGQAWAELGTMAERIPLEETTKEPGTYLGNYTIEPGSSGMGQKLTGHLKLGPRSDVLVAPKPVNVFGGLFRVKIFSPPTGSRVEQNFVIKGRTRPNSKVIMAPRLGFSDGITSPVTNPSNTGRRADPTTGSVEGQSDAQGFFTIEYGVPVVLPNLLVAIAVYAVDPEGNRSVPVQLRYRFD